MDLFDKFNDLADNFSGTKIYYCSECESYTGNKICYHGIICSCKGLEWYKGEYDYTDFIDTMCECTEYICEDLIKLKKEHGCFYKDTYNITKIYINSKDVIINNKNFINNNCNCGECENCYESFFKNGKKIYVSNKFDICNFPYPDEECCLSTGFYYFTTKESCCKECRNKVSDICSNYVDQKEYKTNYIFTL